MKLAATLYTIGIGMVASIGAYRVGERVAEHILLAQYTMAIIGVGLVFIVAGSAVTIAGWISEALDTGE